jgi:hypothetical protein
MTRKVMRVNASAPVNAIALVGMRAGGGAGSVRRHDAAYQGNPVSMFRGTARR